MEIVKFEIYRSNGFWCARGIGVDIFTQGKTLDELARNIEEAVLAHFGEKKEIQIFSLLTLKVPLHEATSC